MLEEQVKGLIAKYPNDVPRPEYWGGYRLVPNEIEFWQLRINRLHDRLLYTRGESGDWTIQRLNP